MDILSYKLSVPHIGNNNPRDIIFGPQEVRSVAHGISFMLPSGCVAASVLGEVYGIESISQDGGRIYVTGQVASLADVIRSHAEPLDFKYLRLIPTSAPFVDGNQVSIHSSVQGVGSFKNAYVTTVITTENKAITFAALFDDSAALLFRGIVVEISDSVGDIAT